jgi:hypothetical protein
MTAAAVPGRALSRPAAVAALALAGAAATGLADPVHHDLPLCPFRMLTGLSCPLCGGLRAVYSLTHLEFAAAVRDNVLVVAALPILLWYWVDWMRRAGRGRPERRPGRAVLAGLWLVAAGFTVVRNLPAASWLRPPGG